jgi:heptose I phosphotransferase
MTRAPASLPPTAPATATATATATDPATAGPSAGFVELEPGRLWAAGRHVSRLSAAGLGSFEALMGFGGGDVYRRFAGRLTVRLEIGGAAFYLKRHREAAEPRTWAEMLARKSVSDARREFDRIAEVRAAGIAAAEPAALGEARLPGDGRSLLLLEEIPDARPADDVLLTPALSERAAPAARQRLLSRIAGLVRRLHDAGFNHRDLYLCHVFVGGLSAGRAEEGPLTLIDLQRMGHAAGGAGRRWRVKDAAQMTYSDRPGVLSNTDRMRLLRAYWGEGPDALGDARAFRAFADEVFAKAEGIRRRDDRRRAGAV